MVAEKELIIICVDTSVYTTRKFAYSGCSFRLQLEAIRLYCQAKLKSNPKTAIGIRGMGSPKTWLKPTSDLDKILFYISPTCLRRGGDLDFIGGVGCSQMYLAHQPYKLKRTLIFTGGPFTFTPEIAEGFGTVFKEMGVAVDFLNFTLEEGSTYFKKLIESFVTAADKNGNSHLRHVPPEPSTCISHYLPSPPAIIPRALIEQGEIVAVAAKNKKAEDYKRKNQAAAARNKKAQGYNRENQAVAHDDECVKAHNSLELRNKFEPLSLDNNENVKLGKGKMVAERSMSAAELRR